VIAFELLWGNFIYLVFLEGFILKKNIIVKVIAIVATVVCACGVGAVNKVKKVKEKRQIKYGFSAVE
jgi:hypothetical protein